MAQAAIQQRAANGNASGTPEDVIDGSLGTPIDEETDPLADVKKLPETDKIRPDGYALVVQFHFTHYRNFPQHFGMAAYQNCTKEEIRRILHNPDDVVSEACEQLKNSLATAKLESRTGRDPVPENVGYALHIRPVNPALKAIFPDLIPLKALELPEVASLCFADFENVPTCFAVLSAEEKDPNAKKARPAVGSGHRVQRSRSRNGQPEHEPEHERDRDRRSPPSIPIQQRLSRRPGPPEHKRRNQWEAPPPASSAPPHKNHKKIYLTNDGDILPEHLAHMATFAVASTDHLPRVHADGRPYDPAIQLKWTFDVSSLRGDPKNFV